MSKGFRVIESVLKGDEHLLFNLTVLSELHKAGLLNSFFASSEIFNLYQKHLSFLGSFKARKDDLFSGRILFLTGSWSGLFKCLIIKGEKSMIFHNFYGCLDEKSWKSCVKLYGYKLLLRLGRVKPIVLNKYIKKYLDDRTHLSHGVLQIVYCPKIIQDIAQAEDREDKIEKAVFGNLFPGKINITYLEILNPEHFGKLHGGMEYKNSINRYLNTKEYYNLFLRTEKICIFNNNNHRVASGVLTDAVTLGKKIIFFEDDYLKMLALENNLECVAVNNYFEINLQSLHEIFYMNFVKDLERL